MIKWESSEWMSYDKILHVVAGFMISAFAGILVNILIAFGKEVWDEYDYDGFDWKDMIMTVVGGLPILFLG